MKENDLLICAPCDELRTESEKPHEICARVTDADHEHGIVYLDCYLDRGRVHLEDRIGKPFPMAKMEPYYRPMRREEVLEFRDGLTALIKKRPRYENLACAEGTLDTCRKKLEEEQRASATPQRIGGTG